MLKTDVGTGLIWRLSSSQSLSIGLSIQDEDMQVARPAPQVSIQGIHLIANLLHYLSHTLQVRML